MGYGIVLHLNDQLVRAEGMDAARIGADLAAVVGGDAYPSMHTGSTAGAWTAAGAYHSTHLHAFRATPDGIVEIDPSEDDDSEPWAWQAQLTGRAHHEAARSLQRNPARWAQLASRGPNMIENIFGPDRSRQSLASIWWFHADAIRCGNPADAGETVLRLIDTYDGEGTSVGSHANALNKLGALIGPAAMRVVWSGNRMCLPGDLVEVELPRWERLTAGRR